MSLRLAGFAAALLASTSVQAQVQTAIVPDVTPDRATGTLITVDDKTVTIDGGQQTGGNLFHSFADFSLAAGDTARWTFTFGDPNSITNVINRVTGGNPSQIDGAIDSTGLPNAAFFFINPSGVIFGENAQVNVPGAAHFSTGSHVDFADGARFSAIAPDGSAFTMAAPASFGFLGNEAALAVLGGSESAPLAFAGSLALSASGVGIQGREVFATGFAVTATGSTALNVPVAGALFDAAASDGVIALADSRLETYDGGTIALAAGRILMSFGNLRSAATPNDTSSSIRIAAGEFEMEGGTIISDVRGEMAGGGIGIEALRSVSISGANIFADSYGSGDAGIVSISAPQLVIDNAFITSESFADGNSGAVLFVGDNVSVTDSRISSEAADSGDAGAIALLGGDVTVKDTVLLTNAAGAGAGGGIAFVADATLTLVRNEARSNNVDGSAGAIALEAARISITGGVLESTTLGRGPGGAITVEASQSIDIANANIFSDTMGTGDAGLVAINAPAIKIVGGQITSETFNAGAAGSVTVDGEAITVDFALLSSTSMDTGNAGVVELTGRTIALVDADLQSNANTTGLGGGVFVQASELLSLDRTDISSFNTDGDGGAVTLQAQDITIFGGSIESSSFGSGAGGVIVVEAERSLDIQAALIFSDAAQVGAAGFVQLSAPLLDIGGSIITSEAFGAGAAGSINIFGDTVSVTTTTMSSASSDSGDAGVIEFDAGALTIANSRLSTSVTDPTLAAEGGSIILNADRIAILDDSRLSSSTSGLGFGGRIFLSSQSLMIDGRSVIATETDGPGEAGAVLIDTGDFKLAGQSTVSASTTGAGNAGFIEIDATSFLINASTLSSEASASADGNSGRISVSARSLAINDGGGILTASRGTGLSGNISVDAGTITLSNGGYLDSDTADGQGGGVKVNATESLALSGRAYISAGTTGSGDAGSLSIATPRLSLDNSRIEAESRALGSAGSIDIATSELLLENGSLITATTFADGAGGQLLVNAESIVLGRASGLVTQTAGSGAAGSILIEANSLEIQRGFIRSSSFIAPEADPSVLPQGAAGSILIDTGTLNVRQGSISSSTVGGGLAGLIGISAETIELVESSLESIASPTATGGAGAILVGARQFLLLTDGSQISSSNDGFATDAESAGAILIEAANIELVNGSEIATNSANGPAGAISLTLTEGRFLRLRGGVLGPSTITTSSGPGTGGIITIASPLAIISQGGNILALGDQGGANVQIRSQFFIDAADTLDLILVDGDFTFDGQLDYVASGEEPRDVSLLDAGAVLSGRCRADQSRGGASQLGIAPIGPYGTVGAAEGADEADSTGDTAALELLQASRPCG